MKHPLWYNNTYEQVYDSDRDIVPTQLLVEKYNDMREALVELGKAIEEGDPEDIAARWINASKYID